MSQSINPLQLLKSLSDATAGLVRRLAPSIVNVNSTMTSGTGVVVNSDGYVVTCHHVLGRSASIKTGSGEKIFEARTVGVDPYSDIALLKTEQKDLKPLEIGDSDKLSPGQFVLALANPFNRQPTVTTGIITSIGATLRGWRGTAMENVIATDAKLNPGFSGGPLVDASGRMIGLNTAYVWSRGIAIPSNKVKNIADLLMSGGKIKRAYLGIVSNTVPIPQETAKQTHISQDAGVMVFSVEPGSPAKKGGLAMGDVIVKFNDQSVANFYDLPQLLTENLAGKNIKLSILRGEKLMELTVIPSLVEGDDDE
ncbi:MAG TPA: trypsin-like peptidase domain-containing protein [Patescibacteria group bacterium]|nr:trypsin-like peptidase domain-containing protein [Patescibacteria group bacterium]